MANNFGFEPVETGEYFFISYNSEDVDRVKEICNSLSSDGVPLWYDGGIKYKTDKGWKTQLAEHIRNSAGMILFFTKGILNKPTPITEFEYEIAKTHKKTVIVVFLDEVNKTDVPASQEFWVQDIYNNQVVTTQKTVSDYCEEIKRLLEIEEKNTLNEITNINIANIDDPLLKRAFVLLEDEEFEQADAKLEAVLDKDCECAMAYVGKLIIDLNKNIDANKSFENNKNYIRFCKYANDDEKKQINEYLNTLVKRLCKNKGETKRKAKEEIVCNASEFTECKLGSIVHFGNYPQGENGEVQPIEWIVLENNGKNILLISKYALNCKPYHNADKNITWQRCDLRKWLNKTFFNTAFNKEEQIKIKSSLVCPQKNEWYKTTIQGFITIDKIFLLSISEVNRYLDKEQSVTDWTPYCKKQVKYRYDMGYCWWLRSSGEYEYLAAYVDSYGRNHCNGYRVSITDFAVRPVLRIRL